MPITIKHQPVAAAMTGAYATGVGAAQERQRRERMALLENEQDRRFKVGAMLQREMWDQSRLDQQQAFWDRQNDERIGWERERDQNRREMEWEKWRQEDTERIHAGTHAYVPQQEKDRNKLLQERAKLDFALRTGEINEQEYDSLREQIDQGLASIRALPVRPGDEPETPADQIAKGSYTDENGNVWIRGKEPGRWVIEKGAWNPKQAEFERSQKQADELNKKRERINTDRNKLKGEMRKRKQQLKDIGTPAGEIDDQIAAEFADEVAALDAEEKALTSQPAPAPQGTPVAAEQGLAPPGPAKSATIQIDDAVLNPDGTWGPSKPITLPQDITETTRQMMRNQVLPGEFIMPGSPAAAQPDADLQNVENQLRGTRNPLLVVPRITDPTYTTYGG